MGNSVEPVRVLQARRLLEALFHGEEQTQKRYEIILDHLNVHPGTKRRALTRFVLSKAKLLVNA